MHKCTKGSLSPIHTRAKHGNSEVCVFSGKMQDLDFKGVWAKEILGLWLCFRGHPIWPRQSSIIRLAGEDDYLINGGYREIWVFDLIAFIRPRIVKMSFGLCTSRQLLHALGLESAVLSCCQSFARGMGFRCSKTMSQKSHVHCQVLGSVGFIPWTCLSKFCRFPHWFLSLSAAKIVIRCTDWECENA